MLAVDVDAEDAILDLQAVDSDPGPLDIELVVRRHYGTLRGGVGDRSDLVGPEPERLLAGSYQVRSYASWPPA